MTDPKKFQQERLEWSRWKHAILTGYLKRFSGILQKHQIIYVVDGFAGPGIYEDGQEGSPLYAAKVAAKLYEINRDYELRCINTERDDAVYDNLVVATDSYSNYVTNFHGDFSDYIPQILEIVGSKPVLFFLDPIGLKGLEWNKLQNILTRGQGLMESEKTELLIRYDAQTSLRLAGFETSDDEYRDSYLNTFHSILGIEDAEYWKRFVSQCNRDNAACVKRMLTEAYQTRLRLHFDYVMRMPIRNQKEQLKYYLIFVTRSLKGVVAMNDTLYEVEGMRAEDIAASQTAVQMSLHGFERPEDLPEEQRNLHDLNALKEYVQETLESKPNKKLRRDDLRATIALEKDCLGRFSGSYYTAVLGGKPKSLRLPGGFVSLASKIRLEGKPGSDETYVSLL